MAGGRGEHRRRRHGLCRFCRQGVDAAGSRQARFAGPLAGPMVCATRPGPLPCRFQPCVRVDKGRPRLPGRRGRIPEGGAGVVGFVGADIDQSRFSKPHDIGKAQWDLRSRANVGGRPIGGRRAGRFPCLRRHFPLTGAGAAASIRAGRTSGRRARRALEFFPYPRSQGAG